MTYEGSAPRRVASYADSAPRRVASYVDSAPRRGASYADSAPRRGGVLCGRHNFFEKKLTKSFLSPAGGTGAPEIFVSAVLTSPPKGQRAGRAAARSSLTGFQLESQPVSYHGNKLTVCRFSLNARHCITKIRLQRFQISPIPCNLDCMTDRALYP